MAIEEGKIEEIDGVKELQDWLMGRVADDDDIIVDQMQEQYAQEYENIEETDPHPVKGSEEYVKNMELLNTTIADLKDKEEAGTSGLTQQQIESKKKITDGIRPCWYVGERDEKERPHGRGKLVYENKDVFNGTFEHGVLNRTGEIMRATENCLKTEGTWKNGLLDGECRVNSVNGGWVEGYFKNGVPHGFQREFGVRMAMGKHQLLFLGRFYKGIARGFCWKGLLGNGFLCGQVDEKGEFTGDDIAFIYPDFKMALRGTFKNGLLVNARQCIVEGSVQEKGLFIPLFSAVSGPEYKFENPSLKCIAARDPMLRDPWEDAMVEVKPSTLPQGGEGLFAKGDIKKHQVFALYNGIRIKTSTYASKHMGHSDYRIRLNADFDLDIPNSSIRLDKYCATLGHKANHSFAQNAEWTIFEHPRFGIIRGLAAQKDIKAGEEILINYQMNLADSPEWYRVIWLKHQREYKKASDASIMRILDRYYENSGKRMPLPENDELNVPEPSGIDNLEELHEAEIDRNGELVDKEQIVENLGIQNGKEDSRFEEIED